MTIEQQTRYWAVAVAVMLGLLWALGDVLLPFLVGAALAYFLNPIATRLTVRGIPRVLAVSLIMVLMMGVTVVLILLIVPSVVGEAAQLAQAAPDLLRRLQEVLSERFPDLLDADSQLRQTLSGMGETIRDRGLALADGVLRSVSGVISVIVFIVIAPVVTFYLLVDWPRLTATIDEALPRQHAPVIRDLLSQIDLALAGFVRGQVTVCLILSVYYASALLIAGLQFGLVVGVIAGLVSFIPYIGAIAGGSLAIGLALFQFWGTPVPILVVVGIFVVGQVLESNVLVPNMVGGSVGLHPVWLLFAVSAFGSAFGFTGMLIAVPLAAALGVLVRFGFERYKASALYAHDTPPAP